MTLLEVGVDRPGLVGAVPRASAGGDDREREVVVDVRVHARRARTGPAGRPRVARRSTSGAHARFDHPPVRREVARDVEEQAGEPHVEVLDEGWSANVPVGDLVATSAVTRRYTSRKTPRPSCGDQPAPHAGPSSATTCPDDGAGTAHRAQHRQSAGRDRRIRWGGDRRLRRPVLVRRPRQRRWRSASGPPRRRARTGRSSTSAPPRSTTTTCGRCAASGLRAEQLPMILGTDAAGVTADGREVVVHGVIGGASGTAWGPTSRAPCCPSGTPGTLAEQVAVPTWNLVDKPAELSFVEAACLPTAWLTAYRMLFRSGGATPGQRVLVQGAGGGLATAAILLGAAAGLEVDRDQPVRGAPRRGRCRSAPPRPSRPGRGCRASTSCSRASARRRGRTRCARSGPAARSSWPARPAATPSRPSSTRIFFQEITRRRRHDGLARRPAAPARVPRAHRRAAARRLDVPADRRARRRAAAGGRRRSSARSCSSLDRRRAGRDDVLGPDYRVRDARRCGPTTRATSSRAWSGTPRRRPSRCARRARSSTSTAGPTTSSRPGSPSTGTPAAPRSTPSTCASTAAACARDQTPGYVDDLHAYDEEIEASLDVVRGDLGAHARVMVDGPLDRRARRGAVGRPAPRRAQRARAQQPVARAAGVVGAAAPQRAGRRADRPVPAQGAAAQHRPRLLRPHAEQRQRRRVDVRHRAGGRRRRSPSAPGGCRRS